MLLVAVRTGLGISIILAILGIVQTQSITDPLLLFAAAGLVPGTNIEIPPELTLIMVGAVLMAIIAALFAQHLAYRATLEAILPEYIQEDAADSENRTPRLRRVVLAGRSVLYLASETSREFYLWLRSFGRPAIAQAISVRRELTTTLVRFDDALSRLDIRENLELFDVRLRIWTRETSKKVNVWADKALEYFVRLTFRQ